MLLVDKPAGPSSHDAVAAARRTLGERRIGHAGTLDPFATGLLVLLLGRATRLLPYMSGEPKVYDAHLAFGSETDTDDATGSTSREAPLPTHEAVADAIASLTGTIEQLPPAYSAKKVAGRRAYAAARRGEALALRPVAVQVHRWELLGWAGSVLRARITCGGGTYIRALARDLGRATGSAAHLRELRRLRSGPFAVTDAVALDALTPETTLLPMRAALPGMPEQALDAEALRRITHGMRITSTVDGDRAGLVDEAGALVAIADRVGDEWQPRLVLA